MEIHIVMDSAKEKVIRVELTLNLNQETEIVTLGQMEAVTHGEMETVTHGETETVTHGEMETVTHGETEIVTLGQMEIVRHGIKSVQNTTKNVLDGTIQHVRHGVDGQDGLTIMDVHHQQVKHLKFNVKQFITKKIIIKKANFYLLFFIFIAL